MTISSGATGRRGELHVFGELLKREIIPYAPIVDLEGIDCIIRKSDGSYVELQVKTLNTPKTPMWWQVSILLNRRTTTTLSSRLRLDGRRGFYRLRCSSRMLPGRQDRNITFTI